MTLKIWLDPEKKKIIDHMKFALGLHRSWFLFLCSGYSHLWVKMISLLISGEILKEKIGKLVKVILFFIDL